MGRLQGGDDPFSLRQEPEGVQHLGVMVEDFDKAVADGWTAALTGLLAFSAAAQAKDYLKGERPQLRGYSDAVITEGGKIVWLAGQTATVDDNGKPLDSTANYLPFVPPNQGGDHFGWTGVFRAAGTIFFEWESLLKTSRRGSGTVTTPTFGSMVQKG